MPILACRKARLIEENPEYGKVEVEWIENEHPEIIANYDYANRCSMMVRRNMRPSI